MKQDLQVESAPRKHHEPGEGSGNSLGESESFLRQLHIFAVGLLGAFLLRVLYRTYRWRFHGLANQMNFFRENTAPAIFVFWHGRQLLMPRFYQLMGGPKGKIYTLISRHRDGRFIARVLSFLGFGSVAGSSTRGGAEALLQLRRYLAGGCHVAITPDGPRGPAGSVKLGCVALARNAGVPIFPVAIGADRSWHFSSWDSMMLPKPFAKIVGVIGEPLYVPADCMQQGLEDMRRRVERALFAATQVADGG